MMKIDIATLDKSIDSKLLFDKIPTDLSTGLEIVYRNNLFFRFAPKQQEACHHETNIPLMEIS